MRLSDVSQNLTRPVEKSFISVVKLDISPPKHKHIDSTEIIGFKVQSAYHYSAFYPDFPLSSIVKRI